MAADSSSSNNNSPRSQSIINTAAVAGGDGGGGSNSPQSRRRSLPSPWAQVVRGEPESSSSSPSLSAAVVAPRSPSSSPPPPIAASAAAAAPEQGSYSASSSDSSGSNAQGESSVDNGGNAAPPRRPAWNRPLNGVVEPVSVMGGAVSWPALSESTRPGPRSTPDSTRPISNGSSSASQAPIVNQPPQRQVNANANANANTNANPNPNANSNASHAMPGRQRSMRHRGGSSNNHNGGGSAQGGFNRPPPPPPPPLPPPFPVIEIPYGNLVTPVVMDSSVRGPRPMGGVGPQPHASNDHSSHRNSSRRGNFGPRPRGDGSYHNNHGGRRDQDRRDAHLQPFVPPTAGFIPPPPPGTPPYGPLPMRPFPGPMGFDMASPLIYVPTLPPDSFRGVPFIAQAPPPPMFYPMMDPNLPVMIVNQIDYYFSDENLVKDDFLRSNMDDEGWVPISLIANFPRVAQLTSSTEFILECLKASTAVEIQGDKVRRRDGWRRWVRTPARFNGDSDSHSTGESTDNILANSIQNVSLDDATSSRNNTTDAVETDTGPSIRPSGEFTGRSELDHADGTAEDISSSQPRTVVA